MIELDIYACIGFILMSFGIGIMIGGAFRLHQNANYYLMKSETKTNPFATRIFINGKFYFLIEESYFLDEYTHKRFVEIGNNQILKSVFISNRVR